MADSHKQHHGKHPQEYLPHEIETREARKLRARRQAHRSVWFGLGMFGMVGWSVAIPTMAGVAVGWWLDHTFRSRYSWTLMFMAMGMAGGLYLAWTWIQRESTRDHNIGPRDPHK